jgi:hypothetical protein
MLGYRADVVNERKIPQNFYALRVAKAGDFCLWKCRCDGPDGGGGQQRVANAGDLNDEYGFSLHICFTKSFSRLPAAAGNIQR